MNDVIQIITKDNPADTFYFHKDHTLVQVAE